MTERNQELRRLIREYRKARGVTQAEVAEMIDVNRETYCRMENGHGPIRRFDDICRAIGCDPTALLREAGFSAQSQSPNKRRKGQK